MVRQLPVLVSLFGTNSHYWVLVVLGFALTALVDWRENLVTTNSRYVCWVEFQNGDHEQAIT